MKGWGIGIIVSTTVFMSIFLLGFFDDPIYAVSRHWDIYAMFVLLPYLTGITLIYFGLKRARRNNGKRLL